MTVYGLIGSSAQDEPLEPYSIIATGWVLMKYGRRPEDGRPYYASDDGEWLLSPSPEEIEQIITSAEAEKSYFLTRASNMIGAISDEIAELVENGSDVPEYLGSALKAWKQYRVAVKNIDVSLAPNIEWPLILLENGI